MERRGVTALARKLRLRPSLPALMQPTIAALQCKVKEAAVIASFM
jgi:hypothetical protein